MIVGIVTIFNFSSEKRSKFNENFFGGKIEKFEILLEILKFTYFYSKFDRVLALRLIV